MIELESDFSKFLNDNFEFAESMFEGAVNIYSSRNLKLRIVRDRNTKLYMDTSIHENPQTPSDWIIMGDLRSYMLNNDDYLEGADFHEVSTFFQENYQNILWLLNTKYDDVRKSLAERGQHRAEVLFGYIPKPETKDVHKPTEAVKEQKRKRWWKL